MNKEIISVIIPTYNRENTILRTLKSVLNQTYQNLEIIVVDDCSTDRTVQIVKNLMEKDKRIKLLINERNRGPNYSRNRGIQHSKGKYIALLDSDDEWFSEKLEKQLHKLKICNPNVGVVYCGALYYRNNKFIKIILPKHRGFILKNLILFGNIVGGCSFTLIKRKVFEKCGLFDEHESLRNGGSQDFDMWIKISQYFEFDYVNEILLKHNLQNDSITIITKFKNPIRKLDAYIYIHKKYNHIFQSIPDAYIYHCYRLFLYLNLIRKKELARKIIFMALKKKIFKMKTYYYIFCYLIIYYSIFDIISRLGIINYLSYFREFIY